MLELLDLDNVYPRYGYPNDMLVHLNVWSARVRDIPSRPIYGIGEKSGIRLRSVVPRISWLLMKGFFWRMGHRYVIRDFHPLVFFYMAGFFSGLIGIALGQLRGRQSLLGQSAERRNGDPRRAHADVLRPLHAVRDVVRHGDEQGPR